jgi:hypothetical protein
MKRLRHARRYILVKPRQSQGRFFAQLPLGKEITPRLCAGVREAGIHAGQVVTVHVADQTITIDLDDKDSRTVRRTTAQPVRSIKAAQSRKDSRVS